MNVAQKAVILIGVVIILLLGLYPPWSHVYYQKGYPKIKGITMYGFIFNPPPDPLFSFWTKCIEEDSSLNPEEKRDALIKGLREYRSSTILDYPRLLVQWVMVIIVITGIWLVLKKKS